LPGVTFQRQAGLPGQFSGWKHAQRPTEGAAGFPSIENIAQVLLGHCGFPDFFRVDILQVGDGFRCIQKNASIEPRHQVFIPGRQEDELAVC